MTINMTIPILLLLTMRKIETCEGDGLDRMDNIGSAAGSHGIKHSIAVDDDDDDGDGGGNDHHVHHDDGYPAYSHHDKIPPWWENVSNDEGGNVSVSKNHHTPLHHDELYFEVYMYKVTHITSVSFGINF